MFNAKSKLVNERKLGVDDRVDEIINTPDSPLGMLYKQAEVLNKNKIKKSYVEACLFCERDFEKISKILELNLEIIQIYAEFFFEVEGIDKLSKIEHIDSIKDKNETLLKMYAMAHGIAFISWRLGDRVSLSPVEGLTDLFSTSMYKAKESMFNSSSSEAGKESIKWVKQATDIGRLLKLWVMDSSAARKDLEIAIREVVPDFEGLDLILEENGINFEQLGSIEDLNKEQE